MGLDSSTRLVDDSIGHPAGDGVVDHGWLSDGGIVDSSTRLVGDGIGNSIGHSVGDGVDHHRWRVDDGAVADVR